MSEPVSNLALVHSEAPGPALAPRPPRGSAHPVTWQELGQLVRLQAPLLSAPWPGVPGLCVVCRGPSGKRARCFQCELHDQCAQGSLADVVVPVAYAIKGSAHARHLWQYKSARRSGPDGANAAGLLLLALLLVFLRDHRACVWRAAGMTGGPTHLAVVPTARSRPGTHPLRALITPYLSCPWADLRARPGTGQDRDLDPGRFAAAPAPGARVLLVDDTWTTGASAQSAAMALRRAGARAVATVVLGRHVSGPVSAAAVLGPASLPFRAGGCAVHGDHEVTG